jgi:hypothetical protein
MHETKKKKNDVLLLTLGMNQFIRGFLIQLLFVPDEVHYGNSELKLACILR